MLNFSGGGEEADRSLSPQDVSFMANSPLFLFSDISVLAVFFVFSAFRRPDGLFWRIVASGNIKAHAINRYPIEDR